MADEKEYGSIKDLIRDAERMELRIKELEKSISEKDAKIEMLETLNKKVMEEIGKAESEILELRYKIKELERREAKLIALESAGVDNWIGYDDAMDIMESDVLEGGVKEPDSEIPMGNRLPLEVLGEPRRTISPFDATQRWSNDAKPYQDADYVFGKPDSIDEPAGD